MIRRKWLLIERWHSAILVETSGLDLNFTRAMIYRDVATEMGRSIYLYLNCKPLRLPSQPSAVENSLRKPRCLTPEHPIIHRQMLHNTVRKHARRCSGEALSPAAMFLPPNESRRSPFLKAWRFVKQFFLDGCLSPRAPPPPPPI